MVEEKIKNLSSIIAKNRQNAVTNGNDNGNMEILSYNKKADEQLGKSEPHRTDKKINDVHGDQNLNPKDNNQQEDSKDVEMISTFGVFRFAEGIEWLLLFFGILVAWVAGACVPAMVILLGNLTKALVRYASQKANILEKCFNITANNTDPFGFNNSDLFHFNDTMSDDEFYDEVKKYGIGLSLTGVAQFLLSYIMVVCLNKAAERQIYRIRSTFLVAVLKQDIGWYDTYQTGEFASRTADDIAKLQNGIGDKIGMFNFFVSTFLLSIINSFIHGWKLTLVLLAVIPVMCIIIGAIGKIQTKFSESEMGAYATAGSIAEEVLAATRTVIAFGGEAKESARYEKNLVGATRAGIKRGVMTAVAAGLMWLTVYAVFALAFWYGIRLILDGGYTPQSFIIVFFGVFMGAMNLAQTAPHIEAFSQARAAAVCIFNIIDRDPVIDSSSAEGLQPISLTGNIEFGDVAFNYPSRPEVPILDGLNLQVKKGETVALVGESGCGKSTIVQLLQRFYDPLKGTIKLDGCDIRLLNVGWLRNHIGTVGQEPVLFGTTIAENIRYGLEGASMEDVEKAAKEANAHEFIMKLPMKYETLVGDRGAQLSGGQKQRVAIARALIKNPRILLLDEATSALDSESEAVVQQALDKARQGRTTIIVAHRLSTIRNADKIAVFCDGRVKEIGTHAELMEIDGIYLQLVSAQMSGKEELDNLDENGPRNRSYRAQRSLSTRSGDSYDGNMESLSARVSLTDRKFSWSKEEEELDRKLQPSLRKVLQQNMPEWKFIVAGCIGAIGTGFSTPMFSLVFGDLMGLLSNCDPNDIRRQSVNYAYIYLIIGAFTACVMFLQISMFAVAGEHLTRRLRKLSFAAMLKQEIGWFDEPQNSVGILCSKLSGDAASVQGATGSRIGTIIQAFCTLGAATIISLFLSWKLALITMAFIPLVLASTYIQKKAVMGQSMIEMNAFDNANKLAIEAISNIRTLASLHREKAFHTLYMATLVEPHRKALKKTHLIGAVFGFGQSIPYLANACSMFYGGYLVLHEDLPYDKVFKVSQLLIMGTSMVGNAFAFAPNYNKGLLAAARIFRLLERKPLIDSSNNSGLKLNGDFNIEFKDLRFSYPSRPNVQILRGLNLTIPRGKVVALVGSSGCGKSTCIQLLERFYDPTNGCVNLDDTNISSLNIKWLRSQIGIVSQEPILFDRTIAENIAYGDNDRDASMEEIIQAATSANIHKFITKLPGGYDTRVGDKGAQLSGGQKQRIAIARALLRNPKILLLDEATSALDTESEKVVQEALEEAQKGRTCITVAHRLSTIKDANLIAVIHQGKVVEIDSHDQLLAQRGHYHKFYHTQNKAHT